MKTVVEVTFRDLSDTSRRIRALVARTLGVESDSWTSFNKMGVDGLDWDSFLSEYCNELAWSWRASSMKTISAKARVLNYRKYYYSRTRWCGI